MPDLSSSSARTVQRDAGFAQGLILLAASALPVMGVVMLSPVALQMERAMSDAGAGPVSAALALTGPALAIALFAPFAGHLMDRFARRPFYLGALLSYGLLGIAPYFLDTPAAIIAVRFGLGLAEAFIFTANLALMADYFKGPALNRWIAYKSSAAALCGTAFYIIGGMLGQVSWKTPFLAYSVALLILVLAARFIFEPSRGVVAPAAAVQPSEQRRHRMSGPMVVMLLITVCASILFYIVPLQLGRMLSTRGVDATSTIGLFIAIAGLGNPIGALAFRFIPASTSTLLTGASLLAGLGFGIALVAPGPAGLVAGAFVNQLGCGMFVPATVIMVLRLAPADRRATSGGGWSTAFFVGQFLSPLAVVPVLVTTAPMHGLLLLVTVHILFASASWMALNHRAFASPQPVTT